MAIKNKHKGFTIFFAMLVGSLALAVGLAIYDLTVRELDLSSAATQSQYAIYAADTGAECALYWDFKCPGNLCSAGSAGSAFATSSFSLGPLSPSGITCNGVDITGALAAPVAGPSSATTTFTVTFSPQPYYVTVQVEKSGLPARTTVTSKGYNTQSGPNKLERVLYVSY